VSTSDIRATEHGLHEVRRALQAIRHKLPHERWEPIKGYTRIPPNRHYLDATPDFAVAAAWEASTAYSLEDVVVPTTKNGLLYICTTAGNSGAAEPSWSTTIGANTADNAATWETRGAHVIECGEDVPLYSPIKYEYGGTSYYGIVIARSMDDSGLAIARHLAVAGAPMYTDEDITGLWYGTPDTVLLVRLTVPVLGYGDTLTDQVLELKGDQAFLWHSPNAYLATFAMMQLAGVATLPRINVHRYDTSWEVVSRTVADTGIVPALAAPGGTAWTENPLGTMDVTEYCFSPGNWLDLKCTDTHGAEAGLTVMLTFVLE